MTKSAPVVRTRFYELQNFMANFSTAIISIEKGVATMYSDYEKNNPTPFAIKVDISEVPFLDPYRKTFPKIQIALTQTDLFDYMANRQCDAIFDSNDIIELNYKLLTVSRSITNGQYAFVQGILSFRVYRYGKVISEYNVKQHARSEMPPRMQKLIEAEETGIAYMVPRKSRPSPKRRSRAKV